MAGSPETNSPPPRRFGWLPFVLFLLLLLIALFPYLQDRFPAVGRWVQPSRTYEKQGDLAFRRNDCKTALKAYLQALKQKAGLFKRSKRGKGLLYLKIASCYDQQKQQKPALAYAAKAQKLAPKLPWPHVLIAESLRRSGQFKKAAQSYEQSLKILPQHPLLSNNYAMLLTTAPAGHGQDLPKALALIDRALLQKRGNQVALLDTKAQILANQGKFDEALSFETKAATLAKRWRNKKLQQYTARQLQILALRKREASRPKSATRPATQRTAPSSSRPASRPVILRLPPVWRPRPYTLPRAKPHRASHQLLGPQ